MGLIGGFKAKFWSNRPRNRRQEVVCIRFQERSEFDTPTYNNNHQDRVQSNQLEEQPTTSRNNGEIMRNIKKSLKTDQEKPKDDVKTNKPNITTELFPKMTVVTPKQEDKSPKPSKSTEQNKLEDEEDDGGNFKTNLANLLKKKSPEGSHTYISNDSPSPSPMIYSNQASNIFFGDDGDDQNREINLQRPRKTAWTEADTLSNSSSVSA